jgi:hypothetical protein
MVEIRSWLPLQRRLSHFSFSREQFQKLSDLRKEICFALIVSAQEEDRAVSFDVSLGGKPDARLSISRCSPLSFDLNVNIEKSGGENVVLSLFHWFALSTLFAEVFSLAAPITERRGRFWTCKEQQYQRKMSQQGATVGGRQSATHGTEVFLHCFKDVANVFSRPCGTMTTVETRMMMERIVCMGVTAKCPVCTHIFAALTELPVYRKLQSARREPMDDDEKQTVFRVIRLC